MSANPETKQAPTTVNKIGGKNMSQLDKVLNAVNIFESRGEKVVLVVSALEGVTNKLIKAMDDLNGQDYSELDITTAFESTKAVHAVTIEKFFKGDHKIEAYSAYDSAFEILKQALINHKQISKVLMPVVHSFEIRDQVIGFGENMARKLLDIFLRQEGKKTRLLENVRCEETEDAGGKISSRKIEKGVHEAIRNALGGEETENVIRIFGGHVAGTPRGITIDEGRGYSDVTGVDVAVVLREDGENVTATRFLKDVRGIYTANPKNLNDKKNKAVLHEDVSIKVALEIAGAGSKLINPRALSRARQHNLDLQIRDISNLDDDIGTNISTGSILTHHAFKTIVSNMNMDAITIDVPEMADEPGFIAAISDVFAKHGISIDGIFPEGTSITFSIPLPEDESDRKVARKIIRTVLDKLKTIEVNEEQYMVDDIEWDKSRASISVVGKEMHDRVGMLANISGVFSAFGINITAVVHGSKQTRINYLIDKQDCKRAEQLLHSIFVDNDPEIIAEFTKRRAEQTEALTTTFTS